MTNIHFPMPIVLRSSLIDMGGQPLDVAVSLLENRSFIFLQEGNDKNFVVFPASKEGWDHIKDKKGDILYGSFAVDTFRSLAFRSSPVGFMDIPVDTILAGCPDLKAATDISTMLYHVDEASRELSDIMGQDKKPPFPEILNKYGKLQFLTECLFDNGWRGVPAVSIMTDASGEKRPCTSLKDIGYRYSPGNGITCKDSTFDIILKKDNLKNSARHLFEKNQFTADDFSSILDAISSEDGYSQLANVVTNALSR